MVDTAIVADLIWLGGISIFRHALLTRIKVASAQSADHRPVAMMRERGVLSLNQTLSALGVCCVSLLVGFSWRAKRWAPWLMLVSVVGLLGLMSYSIINLL